MLQKLAAYPRQNGLALALREMGRIERTRYTYTPVYRYGYLLATDSRYSIVTGTTSSPRRAAAGRSTSPAPGSSSRTRSATAWDKARGKR